MSSLIFNNQGSSPISVTSGSSQVYSKTDGNLYTQTYGSAEKVIPAAGGIIQVKHVGAALNGSLSAITLPKENQSYTTILSTDFTIRENSTVLIQLNSDLNFIAGASYSAGTLIWCHNRVVCALSTATLPADWQVKSQRYNSFVDNEMNVECVHSVVDAPSGAGTYRYAFQAYCQASHVAAGKINAFTFGETTLGPPGDASGPSLTLMEIQAS